MATGERSRETFSRNLAQSLRCSPRDMCYDLHSSLSRSQPLVPPLVALSNPHRMSAPQWHVRMEKTRYARAGNQRLLRGRIDEGDGCRKGGPGHASRRGSTINQMSISSSKLANRRTYRASRRGSGQEDRCGFQIRDLFHDSPNISKVREKEVSLINVQAVILVI